MPCSYSYLQDLVHFNKLFDGAVSIMVVLKDFENKVEGSSPSKTFFYFFYFLLSQRSRKFFVIYMFAEKSMF